MKKYTAEEYINFIETGRQDEISPNALKLIAKAYRILEDENKYLIDAMLNSEL